jgi:hypothetical protein
MTADSSNPFMQVNDMPMTSFSQDDVPLLRRKVILLLLGKRVW